MAKAAQSKDALQYCMEHSFEDLSPGAVEIALLGSRQKSSESPPIPLGDSELHRF
jgi:hypothetical protein